MLDGRFAPNILLAQKLFWTSTRIKWKLDSICLDIVLISKQDRCTVCVEHTKGSEIIFMHPMEPLGDMGQVESRLSPFGDSISVDAR
jgi:hypothetical protein